MSEQTNKLDGPMKPGGGRGGPQSAEARQALEAQLKADFANVPLPAGLDMTLRSPSLEEAKPDPMTTEEAMEVLSQIGRNMMKTLGGDAGTDMPEVLYPDLDSSCEYPGGEDTQPENVYTNFQMSQIMDEALGLFQRKNSEYGNAIEFTGVVGAVVAATGDIARLRKLVLRSPGHGRETAGNVRDKLMDILVQAAIGIYMVDMENWEGK